MYTCITYYMVVAIASTLFCANELWNKNVSLVFTFQANRSENTAQYFHFVYSNNKQMWVNEQTNKRSYALLKCISVLDLWLFCSFSFLCCAHVADSTRTLWNEYTAPLRVNIHICCDQSNKHQKCSFQMFYFQNHLYSFWSENYLKTFRILKAFKFKF